MKRYQIHLNNGHVIRSTGKNLAEALVKKGYDCETLLEIDCYFEDKI